MISFIGTRIFDNANNNYNLPQYTDIDYYVFSDASEYMMNALSPYERSTYRYPPIIAYLLQGILNFMYVDYTSMCISILQYMIYKLYIHEQLFLNNRELCAFRIRKDIILNF